MSRSARLDRLSASRPSTRMFAAVAVSSALLLTGCAAGQISQTAQQVAAIDGASGDLGSIGVRNALIATPDGPLYATGSELPLNLVLTNKGKTDDTLTAVSSPAADAAWSGEITVPAGDNVSVAGDGENTVTLPGLKSTLCFGQSVPVTFTFAESGELTLRVVIAIPEERTGPRETMAILPPHPVPIWESGAHEAEHADEGEAAGVTAGPSSPLNCNSVPPTGQ